MIVLTVLKWIGIVLGALLALVLLLLLLVLFVPVRYAVKGTVPETELTEGAAGRLKETARGRASFHWLLYLLRGKIAYPEEMSFTVKLLCFTLTGDQKEEKKTKKKEKEKAKKKKPVRQERKEQTGPGVKEKQPENQPAEKKPEAPKSAEKKSAAAKPAAKKAVSVQKKTDAEGHRDAAKQPDAPGQQDAPAKKRFSIRDLLIKPYEVVKKIGYTISSVYDKIGKVRDLLESDVFERAKDCVLKQAGRILKTVLPKKSDVRILYGTGDPYLTAQILAIYSVFSPRVAPFLTLHADFDRKVIGADVDIHGRITLFRLLISAAALYFNKDIRRVRARIEKIRANGEEKHEPESESVQ